MGLYRTKKVDGRTISYHRWAWEQAHGPIPPGMHVHHIDGDRHNNDLANLELMSPGEHSRHHNDRHSRVVVCASCEEPFTPEPTKRARAKTCSRECFRSLMAQVAAEKRPTAKLTVEQTEQIAGLIGTMPQKDIAAMFGVSAPTITRIKKAMVPDPG